MTHNYCTDIYMTHNHFTIQSPVAARCHPHRRTGRPPVPYEWPLCTSASCHFSPTNQKNL